MFKNIISDFKDSANNIADQRRALFNEKLEEFNDPFAKEVSWMPAKRGGVGFRTRTMKISGNETIKFIPSFLPLVVGGISLVLGLWIICSFVTPDIPVAYYFTHLFDSLRTLYMKIQYNHSIKVIAPLLFGLVFVIIGLVALYKLLRPLKFEKQAKIFSKGYPFFIKTTVSFNDIKAIQIISEYCQGSANNSGHLTPNKSYMSYELNLILKNKSRINVVDHSDASEIISGAEQLAKMISVPVWNLS